MSHKFYPTQYNNSYNHNCCNEYTHCYNCNKHNYCNKCHCCNEYDCCNYNFYEQSVINNCCKEDIYMFLGEITHELLESIPIPCGYPSLDEIICLLMNGCTLPYPLPNKQEILKMILCNYSKC